MKATAILKDAYYSKVQPFISRCADSPAGRKVIDVCYRADDYVGGKMLDVVNSRAYENIYNGIGACATGAIRGVRHCKHSVEERYPRVTAAIRDFFTDIFPQ